VLCFAFLELFLMTSSGELIDRAIASPILRAQDVPDKWSQSSSLLDAHEYFRKWDDGRGRDGSTPSVLAVFLFSPSLHQAYELETGLNLLAP
jgi:hypothetical protein